MLTPTRMRDNTSREQLSYNKSGIRPDNTQPQHSPVETIHLHTVLGDTCYTPFDILGSWFI